MAMSQRPSGHLRAVTEPPSGPVWAAVELLPGAVQAALVDARGRILRRGQRHFDPAGPLSGVRVAITGSLDDAGVIGADWSVTGCGVAAGGIIDADAGVIVEINDVPCLNGFNVAALLTELVSAPVRVEHRARVQVMGDRWFGPGRGLATFASVSTGDTLGVGILYEGRILAPDGGRSGAHMTVAVGGTRCSCGKSGCWKTVATTPWLRSAAAEAGLAADSLPELERLAADGDAAARSVVLGYAENLAVGLANIQQLCTPGLFILHGEAATAGDEFLGTVERMLIDSTRSATAHDPRVAAASVGIDDVALLGAAALVIHQGG